MSVAQRMLAATLFAAVAGSSFQLARGQSPDPRFPTPVQPTPPVHGMRNDLNLPPPGMNDGMMQMSPGTRQAPQGMSQYGQPGQAPQQTSPPMPPPGPSQGDSEPTPPTTSEIVQVKERGQYETHATLKTSEGPIEILLYEAEAPQNVANFIQLAKGEKEFVDVKTGKKVTRPFYNGLVFHRVVPNFLIQTGCPYGTGRGGPGYIVKDEISKALRHDKPGVVAMAGARDEKGLIRKDSIGSQFYITLAPLPELDGKTTIIGQVIKGMNVVEKISKKPRGPTDRPIKKVYLYSVDVSEVELGHPQKK